MTCLLHCRQEDVDDFVALGQYEFNRAAKGEKDNVWRNRLEPPKAS